MDVLHLAPFDASAYPPLLNTLRVTSRAGLRSVVVSSLPVRFPALLGEAQSVAPGAPGRGWSQVAFLARRARTLLRERPRLVIGHNPRGALAAALASAPRTAPLVLHCHDFDATAGWKDRVRAAGERWAARRCAQMWVPVRERIEVGRGCGFELDARVVRNCPVRTETLPPRGRLRAWLAEQGLEDAAARRLVIRHGRIGPAHCIRETVEVLAKLPDDVVFVVIGEGSASYLEACRDRARELAVARRFFRHPYVPNDRLMELLVDADVAMNLYAPTSLNAAFPAPNKVYESLAAGLPVVVTAGNSVAEDIERHGAGLAIELGSTTRLADALGRLLADDASTRGARAAARAAHLGEFNYEHQLRNTLLAELIGESLPRPAA